MSGARGKQFQDDSDCRRVVLPGPEVKTADVSAAEAASVPAVPAAWMAAQRVVPEGPCLGPDAGQRPGLPPAL